MAGDQIRTPAEAAYLLDVMPVPLLEVGAENEIAFANAAAEEFFATSRRQLCQRTLQELTGQDHPLLELVVALRREHCRITEYDLTFHSHRFHYEGVTVFASDVPDREGAVVLTFHTSPMVRNLDQQTLLRSAARSISGLADVLVQEVRNPLSGIRGAAQLLSENVAATDVKLTKLICDDVDRIDALVERLSAFTETSSEYRLVNVHRILEHVRQLAVKDFAAEIIISEHYDPSLPYVWGSRDQFERMFLNLLKNAAESVRRNKGAGKIILETRYEPGVGRILPGTSRWRHLPLVVSVCDTGAGVCETTRNHLFEPFSDKEAGDYGLHLAYASKVTDDHGGMIDVESRHNFTKIKIYLPAASESQK